MRFFSISAATYFLLTGTAFAYIDAGSGSMLLQLIIAAVAGSLFVLKSYWNRLLSFFNRQKKSIPSPNQTRDKTMIGE